MSELLPIIFTTICDLVQNMSGMLGFRVYVSRSSSSRGWNRVSCPRSLLGTVGYHEVIDSHSLVQTYHPAWYTSKRSHSIEFAHTPG